MFKRLFVSPAARRRTSWVIAAVLILPFILFFHASGQPQRPGPGGIAGVLLGKPVPWDTFQTQHRWVRRIMDQQAGALPEQFLGPLVTQTTWDRLILLAEARRQRLQADDAELASLIQRTDAFQDEGRFIPERYHRYLAAIGMTPQAFEALLRDDLLIDKLRQRERDAVTVTDAEVRTAYVADHEQLTATLIRFDAARFRPQVEAAVTEDGVRAFYEARQEEFRLPDQLTLEYAGLTLGPLAAEAQFSEEQLRAAYEARQSQFTRNDGTAKPFEEVRDEVRQQMGLSRARARLTDLALDLQEDAAKPLRFEEIAAARALSIQTAGPVDAGASWAPNLPDGAILDAVRGQPVGALSPVVDTDSGVYLARVIERTPSRMPPLDEVRARIRDRLITERAAAAAKQAAEAFHAKAAERMASGVRFEEVLALEPSLETASVAFTRTQPIEQVGFEESLTATAFATLLGQLTPVMATAQGAAILRPETLTPADDAAFAAQQASLREERLRRKQAEHLDEWLTGLRERAKLTSYLE